MTQIQGWAEMPTPFAAKAHSTNTRFASLLQKHPHQFGLTTRACLVKDPGQVAARRPHGDAASVSGSLAAIALDDLKRERCLCRRETEPSA